MKLILGCFLWFEDPATPIILGGIMLSQGFPKSGFFEFENIKSGFFKAQHNFLEIKDFQNYVEPEFLKIWIFQSLSATHCFWLIFMTFKIMLSQNSWKSGFFSIIARLAKLCWSGILWNLKFSQNSVRSGFRKPRKWIFLGST